QPAAALEIGHPAQAGQRGPSCGRPGGLAQCAGSRSGRCAKVKLPVFFRSSFLAGALWTAITSALCGETACLTGPAPLRAGAGTSAVVVQMDAAMADAALDVAGRTCPAQERSPE